METRDQINGSKLFHSIAIYIQNTDIAKSALKNPMIKSIKCFIYTPSAMKV